MRHEIKRLHLLLLLVKASAASAAAAVTQLWWFKSNPLSPFRGGLLLTIIDLANSLQQREHWKINLLKIIHYWLYTVNLYSFSAVVGKPPAQGPLPVCNPPKFGR